MKTIEKYKISYKNIAECYIFFQLQIPSERILYY